MNKMGKKVLASTALMSLVLTTVLSAGPVNAAAGQVTRLGEADRYSTAAKVATSNWTTSDNVVLVSGEGYADAVSASALAKKLNAPILLTTAGSLNADAKAALSTLQAKNVYVVGGNASVSEAVRNELKGNYTLVELQGANRYETNVAVAKELVKLGVDPTNVMMVGGEGFSDALSVAPIAAAKGQILLLGNSNADSMKSVIDFVEANNSKVTVVGTANVISDAILNAVSGTRIDGGADRFDTNLKVLEAFKDTVKMDKMFIANASGNGYADALVASALAGKTAAPLVLVGGEEEEATNNAIAYIKANATKETDLNVVGGTGVVSEATVTDINEAVNPTTPIAGLTEITSVEAVADQIVNAKSDDETLKFTVNGGRETDVEEVLNAGYTVEFNADQTVFEGTTTSKDGSLEENDLKTLIDAGTDHFKYQVVIKKDGVIVAQTAMTRVDIINAETTANSISDVTIKLDDTDAEDNVELKSNTLVEGETATVTKVKGNTIDGKNNVTITDTKFYSSDDFIATVDETTGQITANSAGDFKLIIKSGSTEKEVSMKVTDVKREVYKATASVSSISLGKPTTSGETVSTTFDLKLYDQYGDPMKGIDGTGASTINNTSDNYIFTVTGAIKDGEDQIAASSFTGNTDEDGKIAVTVSTDSSYKSGSGTLQVKNNDARQLLALPVTVGYAGTVDTYKIEAATSDTDFTLDLNTEAADKDGNTKVKFKVNKYDKNGNYIGSIGDANDGSGATVVIAEAKDKEILNLVDADETAPLAAIDTAGTFKVSTLFDDAASILNTEDSKTGNLTITVKDADGIVKATRTITVKDSSPTISSASFGTNLEVANGGSINLKDIIGADNISISGSAVDGKVRIDQNGNIFMNYDEGQVGGAYQVGETDGIDFVYGQDIYLGKLVFSNTSTVYADPFAGTDATVTFHNTSTDDKTITVGIVKAGNTSPSFTTKITVNGQ